MYFCSRWQKKSERQHCCDNVTMFSSQRIFVYSIIMHTTEIIVSVVDLWSLYHLWMFNSCCCYRYNELKLVPSSNSVLLVTCCPLHPLDTCCLQYSWYLLSSQFSWYWSSILSVKTCCLISPPDIFKFLSSPSFWYMFSSQFYWYWLSSPFSWYLLSSVLLVRCLPSSLDTCCLQYSWYLLSSQLSWYLLSSQFC